MGRWSRRLAPLLVRFAGVNQGNAVLDVITRTNGIVAAAVWDYGHGMEMLSIFWAEAVALDPAIGARDQRQMPLSRPGELSALWHAQGLQNVEEQPLTTDLHFASFGDFWRPFLFGQRPAGVYVSSLSGAARRAPESRLRDRLLNGRPDGDFTLRARAWAVRGVVQAGDG